MNVQDIVTEFGAFYLNHGQGQRDLAQILNYKAETDELFTPVNTENTLIRRGVSSVTRVLQPFQKGFTPLGESTFKAQSIPLFGVKVDVEEFPDELVETWLGFLASTNTDRKTWPISRWWAMQIAQKSAEDWELYEVFSGVRVEPTAGTPGAAGTSVDGLRKKINDGITDSLITPISTGALETDPVLFVEQVEDFVKQIDIRYRRASMTLAMNIDQEELFRDGMREKYNKNYNQATDLLAVMNHSNIKVKGYVSWGNSSKLFCSVKENMILGKKNAGRSVNIESEVRQVKLWWDEHRGLGYVIPELVFTNDQDLA